MNTINDYLLRLDRPDFRTAATIPCRFMPLDFGFADNPFESRHSSRREPRGPCVDIRFDCASEISTSIESGHEENDW